MRKVNTKRKIDTSKYVNIDTGELLSSETNITSFNEDTDLVVINSTEYIIIDSKARAYIEKEFNNTEVGRILNMCDMVRSCYNLLFDKNTNSYHTNETLMTELDYTRNKFADFMKKLYKKSIIYYIEGIKDGKECIWIMLNPTLARKRKTIHKSCVAVFEDLSKKTYLKTFVPDELKEKSPIQSGDNDTVISTVIVNNLV